MRDDLFRNLEAPKKWKKVFEACDRPADQEFRASCLATEALLDEMCKSITPNGIKKIADYLKKPEIEFSELSRFFPVDHSKLKLTPDEHRCLNLCKEMLEKDNTYGVKQIIISGLAMLVSEKRYARLYQGEICVNKNENNPDKARKVNANLRKFSKINEKEIAEKIISGKKNIQFSNNDRVTADEDLT